MANKPKKPPTKSAAPRGYDITTNSLFIGMKQLRAQYRLIAEGKFRTLIVVGPPGLGKTFEAGMMLNGNGRKVVDSRANANNVIDKLHQNRHPHIILMWDDTNFVFDSQPTLNILNIAFNPSDSAMITDDRKNAGHGRFPFAAATVFLTNKDVFDPELREFKNDLKPSIKAFVESRFRLKCRLSFDPVECFHYACWVATDGFQMLPKMHDKGVKMSRAAINEVLAWFQQNAHLMAEVSPRRLSNLAELRLKAGDIWESLAAEYLIGNGRAFQVPKLTEKGLNMVDMPPIPDSMRWQIPDGYWKDQAPATEAPAKPAKPVKPASAPEMPEPTPEPPKPARKPKADKPAPKPAPRKKAAAAKADKPAPKPRKKAAAKPGKGKKPVLALPAPEPKPEKPAKSKPPGVIRL